MGGMSRRLEGGKNASPLVASQQGLATLTVFSYYLSSRDMDSSFIVSFLTVQDLTDSSVLVLLNPGIPHCPIVWLLSSSIICMANSLC